MKANGSTMPPTADVRAQLASIDRLLATGRAAEAQAACAALLARESQNAEAHFLSGVAAYQRGALGEALAAFARAAELDPSNPRPHTRRAVTLAAMNRLGEARDAADRAAALKPAMPITLDSLGVVYTRAGAYDRALEMFEAAVAREPRNTGYLYNLAWGRQYLGDLDGAAEVFRRMLEIDAGDPRAWLGLVDLERQSAERNHLDRLEPLFAAAAGHPERRLYLGHALAKTYEDLGDYPRALERLLAGKAEKRLRAGFSLEEQRRLFAAAAETYRGPQDDGGSSSAERPIFVIGLPRTGTTLVDRILSSHPEVVSAGELKTFPLAVRKRAGGASPRLFDAETLRRARQIDVSAVAAEYAGGLQALTGRSSRVVDKLPFNFLFAGLIRRAFPEARIVCLRRHPMDSGLSNYRQMFAADAQLHAYAYDLKNTAEYYVLFDRLVAHWRAVLPAERFMEVQYEALVSEPEPQARRLVEFCGLPWDERCLAFHENASGVRTASAAQVRQPVHTGSVGRWKRYGEGLEPMAQVLRAAGIAF